MMRQSINFGLALIVSLGTPLSAQMPAVPRPTQLPAVPRPTMRPYGGPTSAGDSLDLAIVIFQAAVAHGTRTAHPAALPRLVCLGRIREGDVDPPAGVLAALRQIDTLVVRPLSACQRQPAPRRTPLLTDMLTGQRGIGVLASEPTFARGDGSFEVTLRYDEHELSGAVWKCTGRRRDAKWEVSACRLTLSG